MKRFCATFLMAAMCLLLFAGCQTVEEDQTAGGAPDIQASPSETLPEKTPAATQEPIHTHTYVAEVIAPSCSTGGYTTFTCECGDAYTGNETPATGHNHEAQVVAPTCMSEGYTVYACTCGDTYTDDYTPVTGHNHEAQVIAPTCKSGGYTIYTCACGDTYTGNETGVSGQHSYQSQVIAPTATKEGDTTYFKLGYTVYTCVHCGASYKGNYAAMSDYDPAHKFTIMLERVHSNCCNFGLIFRACECGEKQHIEEAMNPYNHVYGDWIVTVEPQESTPGEKYRMCTLCGHTETDGIAQLLTIRYDEETKTTIYSTGECTVYDRSDLNPDWDPQINVTRHDENYLLVTYYTPEGKYVEIDVEPHDNPNGEHELYILANGEYSHRYFTWGIDVNG